MGEPARKEPEIEQDDHRFDRLLVMMERLCHALERNLAQGQDAAIRAARRVGPTTVEAEARVAARHKRWEGQ